MELQIYKKVHTWYLTDDDGTLYLIKYSKDYTMYTECIGKYTIRQEGEPERE